MDETDAWTAFLKSGSVLDYLTYTSIKNSKDFADNTQEAEHENQHGRPDYKGKEYRGAK